MHKEDSQSAVSLGPTRETLAPAKLHHGLLESRCGTGATANNGATSLWEEQKQREDHATGQNSQEPEYLGPACILADDSPQYRPRIVDNVSLNRKIASHLGVSEPVTQPLQQSGRDLVTELGTPRRWDTVRFMDRDTREKLPDDFVSITICASGLTTNDLRRSDSRLGTDCSGVVRDVGACVQNFLIGSRVACIGIGSIGNTWSDRQSTFQEIPDDMSFAVATSLSFAYTTAYHVLHQLARVQQGDIVLLHGGADPIGQGAIEICKLLGVKVFVTVGSQGEYSLLKSLGLPESQLFYVNDTAAIEAMGQEPNNRQPDVVINIAGADDEQLRLSWRVIAPYGRLINLSKEKELYPDLLDTMGLSRGALLASFDLDHLLREKRHVAENFWAQVMALCYNGSIKGPRNITQYPYSDIGKALGSLDEAIHVARSS